MRLDELARRAGVASTTVRLYQNRGLLPGPRLAGRTGYYGEAHLARLRLIGRLQEQGFSLAGIGRLLETWEQGRDLGDLVGVEQQLDALLDRRPGAGPGAGPGAELVLDADELLGRFPPGALTPEHVQRAVALGLVEPRPDGRVAVPDRRFLETGSALVDLGLPADVVLDEWAHLITVTDAVARRFIAVFEDHLLPAGGPQALDRDQAQQLAVTLARLRTAARQVLAAALDASLAREGANRLGELAPAWSESRS